MKLKEGFNAQDFTVKDMYGKEVKLSGYKGKKIILSFYRNVSCPFCNRRIHQIMGNNVRLKETGTELIFMFEQPGQRQEGSEMCSLPTTIRPLLQVPDFRQELISLDITFPLFLRA